MSSFTALVEPAGQDTTGASDGVAGSGRSIAQERLQRRPGGVLAWILRADARPGPRGELEPLAEVAAILVLDRFGPAFAAPVRRVAVVVPAVEADAQVGTAVLAALAPAGLRAERPGRAASMTVTGHGPSLRNRSGA